MEYNSISSYLESKSSIYDKICAIQKVIDALEIRALEAAEGIGVITDEYQLDDGQVKIRTKYRSPDDIYKAINAFERQKQSYINRYNGHAVALRDVRGLR